MSSPRKPDGEKYFLNCKQDQHYCLLIYFKSHCKAKIKQQINNKERGAKRNWWEITSIKPVVKYRYLSTITIENLLDGEK